MPELDLQCEDLRLADACKNAFESDAQTPADASNPQLVCRAAHLNAEHFHSGAHAIAIHTYSAE